MSSFWDNCTIKAKLFIGIGTILAVFAASSVTVLVFVNGLAHSADLALAHILPVRAEASNAQARLIDADDTAAYYIMDRNAADWAADLRSYDADVSAFKAALPTLDSGADTAHEHETVAALTAWFDAYLAATKQAFALKRAGKSEDGIRTFINFPTAKGQQLIADFVTSTSNRAAVATADVQASSRATVIASIAGALAAIVMGTAIAFALSGQLSNRLRVVTAAIKTAAEVVSTSAREISAGNGDLSQRTEEQAANLEETAASMEQLTATVNQNAENARQANQVAISASAIAIKGGQVVGNVVETMATINASGKKIVDIISVIDGIAFQTNILALNAAVEAARAGEQGRGFAVVAGEVRTLAQRSAAAAKEIKALIGASVENTTAGTLLVGQAGDTMAEIVEAVKRVTDIMSSIAAASIEQGSGIGQVNDAVSQMDQVTQQNAALVEQIAASAGALEDRARDLIEAVGVLSYMQDRSQTVVNAAPLPRRPAAAPAPIKATRPTVTASVPRATVAASAKTAEDDWKSF